MAGSGLDERLVLVAMFADSAAAACAPARVLEAGAGARAGAGAAAGVGAGALASLVEDRVLEPEAVAPHWPGG
jgi:hypothetical protein